MLNEQKLSLRVCGCRQNGGYCSLQMLSGICLMFYCITALRQLRILKTPEMSKVQGSITTQDNGFC